MKEFEIFVKSLSDTLQSLGKIAQALVEKLEQSTQTEPDIKKTTATRKPATKPVRKAMPEKAASKPAKRPARRKAIKPEENASLVGAVQAIIDTNPGIDFKSLQEKTALDDKQLRNTVARLKKQGKIASGGRGVYHPVATTKP